MAAYRRVYDSRHLQADCQEPGSALEPYARQSSLGYLYFCFFIRSLYAPVEQMLCVHDVRQGGGRRTGLVLVVDWSSWRRCRYLVMAGLRAPRRPGRGLG